MPTATLPPKLEGRALPTLNVDGSRRFLRPKLSRGKFWLRRAVVAYLLIAVFTALPYIRINGKPAILLDILHRQFTFFGATFYPTDTLLLMLLLVGIFVGVFFLTALFGRVWCGWACPQTVYMEYVYRPLERWIEGGRSAQIKLDKDGPNIRRFLRYGVFSLVTAFLTHTFLAYFVGVDSLRLWIFGSPFNHPVAFIVVLVTSILMFLDFSWFREQTCAVACPYGRFQSVLLDRRSLIVGYDRHRGEPRATVSHQRTMTAPAGDCIDCGACVLTCPTGIDIRDGLQMECIHCTQCIDACDEVMVKIGKPVGLVRYSSRDELEGKPRRFLRARTVIYPAIVLVVFVVLGWKLSHRSSAEVWLLRGVGAPYSQPTKQQVTNLVRLKVLNKGARAQQFGAALIDAADVTLSSTENPITVAPAEQKVMTLVLTAPRSSFHAGQRRVQVEIEGTDSFHEQVSYLMLGPESDIDGSVEEGE